MLKISKYKVLIVEHFSLQNKTGSEKNADTGTGPFIHLPSNQSTLKTGYVP
jgi:hypothetical protein